jgi:hypothetical protein
MIPALLVTLALSVPGHDVPNTPQAPTSPAVSNAPKSNDEDQTQLERRTRQSGERPHTFGLGGQLGISNRGAGASTRLFFGERLGVNLNASWHKHPSFTTSSGTYSRSTFVTHPSFIFLLTKPDPSKDVDLRPYAGAGASYVSTSRPRFIVPTGTITTQRTSGTGGHVFGGVEMTFSEADWMTISAEGIYYKLPSAFVNRALVGGFNYLLAVHFYLK